MIVWFGKSVSNYAVGSKFSSRKSSIFPNLRPNVNKKWVHAISKRRNAKLSIMFNFETKRICFVTYHQFFLLLERQNKLGPYTGCVRQNENPTNFKILIEPLLVQRQTLNQQKALDLCYLEPERQCSMTSLGNLRCHRILCFWLQIAEIKSFLFLY